MSSSGLRVNLNDEDTRPISAREPTNSFEDKQKYHDRSSTLHLEKILLSSSSTSSNNKIQTQSTHNQRNHHLTTSQHVILQSVDNQSASNGGGLNGGGGGNGSVNGNLNGGQYTYRGVAFNNTGKNWRKLITPAHDSFKKLQQSRPEYSGHDIGGSKMTTAQQDRHHQIGAMTNSNDTSMNTSSDHYSSVKEFNPATNEMLQLRPFHQGTTNTTNTAGKSMIEIEEASGSSGGEEELKEHSKLTHNHLKTSSLRTNHLFTIPNEDREDIILHQKSQNLAGSSNGQAEFGTSSVQMKSLMKSFSNNNFQFYENLHKKYFDKAKEDNSQKSTLQQDKSDKDLFSLTSKTGTLLGLSQLKQSIDSLKTSSQMKYDKTSMMRASSLNANKSQIKDGGENKENQRTMSINFKNSLYKKINATNSVFLDDHSQSQIQLTSQITNNVMRGGLKLRKDYFDTSSSSSSASSKSRKSSHITLEDPHSVNHGNIRKIQDKQKHRDRSHNVLKRSRGRGGYIKDNFEEDLIDENYHSILSRRDLSAHQDDTQSQIEIGVKTPRDFYNDLQQKSKIENSRHVQKQSGIPRSNKGAGTSYNRGKSDHRFYDSQGSPSALFNQGLQSILSSEQNHNQKNSIIQNSFLLSNNQDRTNQNIQNDQDTTNIIFEQPTREEMGDTYKQTTGAQQILMHQPGDDLRPEDLSHMIEQVMNMQSSQISSGNQSQSTNNDILKTFQEYCKIARSRQNLVDSSYNNNLGQFQTNQKKNNLLGSQYANGNGGGGNTPALNNMNSDQMSNQRSINLNKGNYCPQSAAPANRQLGQPLNSGNRQASFIQTTNAKKGGVSHLLQGSSGHRHNPHLDNPMFLPTSAARGGAQQQLDQRSDFTFVLSNPTDFNLECQCDFQPGGGGGDQSSFITQKHQRLLQNSSHNHLSGKRSQRPLPDILASPIYSESGNLPASAVPMCHNCGGCRKYKNQQNKRQLVGEEDRDIIQEESDEEIMGGTFKRNKVFEYKLSNQQQSEQQQQAQDEDRAQMEEEIKFLRLLLAVSHEYMTRLLTDSSQNDVKQSTPLKHEVTKLLGVISSINLNSQQSTTSLLAQNFLSNVLQKESNNNSSNQSDKQRQQEPHPLAQHDKGELFDGNMTMSELQLHNDSQLGRSQNEANDQSKQSELVIMGDIIADEQPRQKYKKKNKKSKKEETGRFISSLISQPETLMQPEQDTIYSYLEDESQYTNEEDDDDNQEFERENASFRKSNRMRKSLKKSNQSLVKTKKLLKKERQINKEQQDMLRKMQTEIEALNYRWMMTEEKLKSGENVYHILSRTTSQFGQPGSHHKNFRSQAAITPPLIGMTSTLGLNTITTQNQISPYLMQNKDNSSHSPIQNSSMTNPHMQSHKILGGVTLQVTPSPVSNPQPYSNLSDSSNPLIHLNDRLTRQIEDNIHLFDSLNQELVTKQAALVQGEVILSEKDREVRRLKTQIKTMDENMRQLIEVTKITTEATEASKVRHIQEMEKIKKRQEDYQAKIQRIQSAVNSVNSASAEGLQNSSRIDGGELSIGQIQNNSSGCDTLPTREKEDKENFNPNKVKLGRDSQFSASMLKESSIKHNDLSNNPATDEDSSALLKYSQDLTSNSHMVQTLRGSKSLRQQ